jgi:phage terminase small subunit
VPPPPAVERDPVALAYWHEHADRLVASGRLRPEFADTFGLLAVMTAECRKLAERLAAEGVVVSTPRGARANPVAYLLRDWRRDLLVLAREFGLTPASDARVPADPREGIGEDDDDGDDDEALRAFTGWSGNR